MRLLRGSSKEGWRLPAMEIEAAVLQTIDSFLRDELRLLEALQLNGAAPGHLRSVLDRALATADEIQRGSPERQRQRLSTLLHMITVHADSLRLEISRSGLAGLLVEPDAGTAEHEELFTLAIPMQLKRRGVEAKLVIQAAGDRSAPPDANLVALIADAHRWINDLAAGRVSSIRDLAR